MGYRVTSIEELEEQNKRLSSGFSRNSMARGLKKVQRNQNILLLANAPKYEELVNTYIQNITPSEEETANEIGTKKRKKALLK